jgi:hypothetical protein
LGIAAGRGFFAPVLLGLGLGVWALGQLGIVLLVQAGARGAMNRPVWPAVFAPVGAALAMAVVVKGFWDRFARGTVDFRGRRLTIRDDIDEAPRAHAG